MDEKKEEEEEGAADKNIKVNIKWGGKKADKKETLAQHLKNKEKVQKQEASKGYYKPMFKTEEDEKEQLDMWMDLINENEENYEPKAPHTFLKRGQG